MNLVIQQHKDLQQAVEAKQLYAELGLDKSNWAKWSQRNITNNEFALEYADYVGFVQTTNGNSTQNFLLSIPFAKKLAMQVKTQKGEDVRNYFLECEQKAQQPQIALPQDYLSALKALVVSEEQKQALAIELKAAEPKINHYDKVVERKNLVNATQVGEKLDGMSAIILNRHLTELGVYNKSVKRGKVFSTWFIQKGYGEMKQSEAGYDQALFTQKGQAWIVEQLTSEGVV